MVSNENNHNNREDALEYSNNSNDLSLKSKLKKNLIIRPVLYNENCVTGLNKIPNNSIQLFISSPPYFMDDERFYRGTLFKDDLNDKEILKLFEELSKEIYRTLKPDGVFCLNMSYNANSPDLNLQIVNIFIKNGFTCREQVAWKKSQYFKISEIRNFTRVYEPVYVLIKSTSIVKLNSKITKYLFKTNQTKGHNDTNFWEISNHTVNHKIKKKLKKVKPNFEEFQSVAFPIELPKKCIELYSSVGDIVCDPFAGSSTTGIACIQTDRNYIGFELDERTFEASNILLNLELKEKKLPF